MRLRCVHALLLLAGCSLCIGQSSGGIIRSVGFAGGISSGPALLCGPGAASPQTAYSLVQVQTVVQTLGNGTQIRSRTETRRMQDASGRTRTETLREVHGAMQAEGISIYDPAKQENITLHQRSHIAEIRRFPSAAMLTRPRPIDREYSEAMRAEYEGQAKFSVRSETEQLQPRMILGERAVGSKTTTITPAGDQGNDSELRSTYEVWSSPRINIPLLIISNDPRSGIVREEVTELHLETPDPGLFQVPAEYRTFDLSPDIEGAKPVSASLQ